jgi:hypothetical protein
MRGGSAIGGTPPGQRVSGVCCAMPAEPPLVALDEHEIADRGRAVHDARLASSRSILDEQRAERARESVGGAVVTFVAGQRAISLPNVQIADRFIRQLLADEPPCVACTLRVVAAVDFAE